MDKDKILKAAEKIAGDKELQELLKKDPEKAVEKVLGVDIPDGTVDMVVKAVKAKLTGDKVADAIGGLDGLKGLLGK